MDVLSSQVYSAIPETYLENLNKKPLSRLVNQLGGNTRSNKQAMIDFLKTFDYQTILEAIKEIEGRDDLNAKTEFRNWLSTQKQDKRATQKEILSLELSNLMTTMNEEELQRLLDLAREIGSDRVVQLL